MNFVKKILRKLLLGNKADSGSYLRHLRRLGMEIGEGTTVYDPRSVLIDETRPWLVKLGKNVQITRGVTLLTHGYEWAVLKGVYGDVLGSAGMVTVGDNVFLGVNAVILKGVTIGSNTIIGAGSVVTRDIPGNCVAAGNPARVLMSLEEFYEKRKAAQLSEARELAAQYRRAYGKDPEDEALSEFFWLFSDGGDPLPGCWEEKLNLLGNGDFSRRKLRENRKPFADKRDFLRQTE